jgi:nicotinamide-nucleotide amidase
MKAVVLAIGDELVSGQTVDSNSAWLSRELGLRGIPAVRHETVGDDRPAIRDAITRAAEEADWVLVTGGLGPTADDLTRDALADAMRAQLRLDEERLVEIRAFFDKRGRTMAETNRQQAMVPRGADSLPNTVGTAPGVMAKLQGATVVLMPGVPHEMKEMFARSAAPALPDGDGAIVHRILHTFGTGESDLGGMISDLMQRGRNPAVGTTAKAGRVSIRIVAHAETRAEADALAETDARELRGRLGELVIGEGDETMASVLGDRLRDTGATLAVAESCTGGLIGKMITDVPGASGYFRGGVLAYDNGVKQSALGVSEEALIAHGAVSEPVARQMAEGVREHIGADWGVGVTGIAGPEGGTEEKPVGLVFIGVAGPDGADVHRHVFPGDREYVRIRTALAAMNYVRVGAAKAKTAERT